MQFSPITTSLIGLAVPNVIVHERHATNHHDTIVLRFSLPQPWSQIEKNKEFLVFYSANNNKLQFPETIEWIERINCVYIWSELATDTCGTAREHFEYITEAYADPRTCSASLTRRKRNTVFVFEKIWLTQIQRWWRRRRYAIRLECRRRWINNKTKISIETNSNVFRWSSSSM